MLYELSTESPTAGGDMMDFTTICAWCKRVIREGNGRLTYGICKPCRATFSRRLAAERARQARTHGMRGAWTP